ncbi:MAG: ABC transporter permease [Thermoleophilia bacterium]|nr:ABC transporter permease [Thermoleophilia bacterium]
MFSDTMLIYRRQMRLSLRQPAWLFFALVQPVFYLVLFGPLLEQVAKTPSFPSGDPWRVFVPGLIVQLGIFGTLFVGFGLIEEIRSGVVDRMRVSPISRVALLMGHVLRDATVLMVQATILVLVALPFGLSLTWPAVVGGLVAVILLAISFASVSYGIAMVAKDEEPLVGLLNLIGPPLLLLSGILLPMTLAPAWLQHVSDANPIKHVVEGLRDMFAGDFWSTTIGWGLLAAIGTAIVCVAGAVRAFQRENP